MMPPLGPMVKYFGPMVFIYSVIQFWSNVPVSPNAQNKSAKKKYFFEQPKKSAKIYD